MISELQALQARQRADRQQGSGAAASAATPTPPPRPSREEADEQQRSVVMSKINGRRFSEHFELVQPPQQAQQTAPGPLPSPTRAFTPPAPLPRPSSMRNVTFTGDAAAQLAPPPGLLVRAPLGYQPDVPHWVSDNGEPVPEDWLDDDQTRRYTIAPPGSVDNPLTFHDETFTDVIFETGKSNICFQACTFVRSVVEGPTRQVTYVNCEFTDATPSQAPTRVSAMGESHNPLVFRQRTVVCTSVDMGNVFAVFDACEFYKSDLFCGRNVSTTSTTFSKRVGESARDCPLVFGVVVGAKTIYGSMRSVPIDVSSRPRPPSMPVFARATSTATRFWRTMSARFKREKEETEMIVGNPEPATTTRERV